MSTNSIFEKNNSAYQKRYGRQIPCGKAETLQKDTYDKCSISSGFAEDIIAQIPDDVLVLFVVGFADGGLVRRIIEKYKNPIFRLVVMEPDEALFYRICQDQSVSDLIDNQKIVLITGNECDDEIVVDKVVESNLHIYNSKHCVMFEMPGFDGSYDTHYAILSNAINKLQRHLQVEFYSVSESKSQRCLNTLHAISLYNNNYSIGDFFKAIPTKEIPVIIVASGPSLLRNVGLLKKAYGKAIIVTLAHSAKTVRDSGCEMDILAVKDGELGQSFLEDEKNTNAMIIMRAGAARDIQEQFDGKIIFYGFDKNLFPYVAEEDMYTSKRESGSIAGDIFYIFVAAGFKKFILIGQDLAYDRNGFTHTGNEKSYGVNDTDRIETEDIYGNMIYSRTDWQNMREYYESMIKEHPDITVIDATEGGAYIHGTKICTFAQAIEENCQTEFAVQTWMKTMIRAHQKADTVQLFQKYYNSAVRIGKKMNYLMELNDKIQRIIEENELHTDEMIVEAYDKGFTELLQSDDAELLWIYAEDVIMRYMLECADVEKKSRFDKTKYEYEFMKELLQGCHELTKSILRLINMDTCSE